jgi:hypothetical protein
MYRRSIIHVLAPLGSVLLLFVVYQIALKPRILPTTPTTAMTSPAIVEPAESPSYPAGGALLRDEVPRARSLDHTATPDGEEGSILTTIRDEIEKGLLGPAEAKLAALPPAILSDNKMTAYVAVLWNNLALRQERLAGPSVSLRAFTRAAQMDPHNQVIQLNLAHNYWALRDPALSTEFLTNLIALAPQEPFPHLAMADLLYEQDKLGDAGTHLTHATERIGRDPALQSYLTLVTAKVRRAEQAETNMVARTSTHFTVKFDGAEDHGTWTTVLDILEEAYRDVGQRFGHFPSKPMVVVLHTRETFQSATGSPAWADGLFDPVLGRIQIPTQGATTDTKWLTNVLRHEFVHALLHDRLGFGSGALPLWLNEGLAMQLAGSEWPELNQIMPEEVKVIPLQYLEGSWGHLPHNVAALAYMEANSATRFLIERFGMSRIDDLLAACAAKESIGTALQTRLSLSYEQFQQQWLDTFQRRRT